MRALPFTTRIFAASNKVTEAFAELSAADNQAIDMQPAIESTILHCNVRNDAILEKKLLHIFQHSAADTIDAITAFAAAIAAISIEKATNEGTCYFGRRLENRFWHANLRRL